MKPHIWTRRAEGLPNLKSSEGDNVRAAFFALALLLSKPDADKQRVKTWFIDKVAEVVRRPHYGSYRKWPVTAMFDEKHAAALGALYEAIRVGMDKAYREGHRDGSNLLRQLARGHITTDGFEAERKRDRFEHLTD